MDNITHTLAGALIGCSFASKRKAAAQPIIAASILSNNFPDADMFYASFLSEPFGYLLHHRGHTHTILGAMVCGVLAYLVIWLLSLLLKRALKPGEKGAVFAVAMLGGLVHLGLDFLNTYGIHPFWPVSNKWIYGDTLFIIEPTIWMTLGLATFSLVTSWRGKFVCLLPVLGGGGLILLSGKVPPTVVGLLAVASLSLSLVVYRLSSEMRAKIWSLCAVAIVLGFCFCGRIVASAHTSDAESGTVLEAFLSPAPANPFCWTSFEMTIENEFVRYRRQTRAPFQALFEVDCEKYSLYAGSLDERVPLSVFNELSRNCRWNAFLQFARLPSVTPCAEGGSCTTDLRFSRAGRRNFSSVPLDGTCPKFLPSWTPPVTFFEKDAK